jgi:hypothetical protein
MSATLGFANEIRVSLNGDHLAIVKFASREDSNYRSVSRTIANLVRISRDKENHLNM